MFSSFQDPKRIFFIFSLLAAAGIGFSIKNFDFNFGPAEKLTANVSDNLKPAIETTSGNYKKTSSSASNAGVSKSSEAYSNPAIVPIIKKSCLFQTSLNPAHQQVLINEVAWMGTLVSPNEEWLELKNISSANLDIAGWHLLSKDGQIKIDFPEESEISANSFYLLERGSGDALPGIKADLTYSGSLNNSGEDLRLFDSDCGLLDEVLADSGGWQSGDNGSKRTMERSLDLTWHLYTGNGSGSPLSLLMGTPRAENSASTSPLAFIKSEPVNSGQISQPSENSANNNSASTTNQNENQVPDPIGNSNLNHIVISEVQTSGGTGKTTNDFIEIYNPTNSQFNLKGYRLVKRTKTGTADTGIKSWTSDTFIPAFGFYLWANSDYSDIGVTPDVTTTSSIADDNGIAIRQGSADTGTIIDSLSWGAAENIFNEGAKFSGNIPASQSLERKAWHNGQCISASGSGENLGNSCDNNDNVSDFEIRVNPASQNSGSATEVNN